MASRTFRIVEFSGPASSLANELGLQALGELTVEGLPATGDAGTPAPPTPPLPAPAFMAAAEAGRGVSRPSKGITDGLRPHRNETEAKSGAADGDTTKRAKLTCSSTAQLAKWLKAPDDDDKAVAAFAPQLPSPSPPPAGPQQHGDTFDALYAIVDGSSVQAVAYNVVEPALPLPASSHSTHERQAPSDDRDRRVDLALRGRVQSGSLVAVPSQRDGAGSRGAKAVSASSSSLGAFSHFASCAALAQVSFARLAVSSPADSNFAHSSLR